MSIESTSSYDNKKLRNFMSEGKNILQQIDDLKGALKDLTTATAEELDLKGPVLSKALRASYKDSFVKDKESVDEVENILILIGEQ